MKYIYPDCLDYIDPEYDFLRDQNGEGREKYWDDQFAHEYLERPPYDGLLVSRAIVGDHIFKGHYTDSEAMRFRREGARTFLRYSEEKYPESMVFGDCGAFQYVKMEEPPYSPEDMVEFYTDGRFTHGCSIDHIIFLFDPKLDEGGFFNTLVPDDARKRYEITLELAEKFLRLSPKIGNKFTPIGVVQGWSPLSMARAAQSLVGMGYKYIAIGGLVPLKTPEIHTVLSAVRNAIPANIQIHLLGFAKADHLHEFFKYKISSFDSSSPMIRAFKDGKKNYFSSSNTDCIDYYKAIRIPQALENNTLKKKIKNGRCSQEELLEKEKQALECIRKYARCNVDLEKAIGAITNYSKDIIWKDEIGDEINKISLVKLSNEYRTTLTSRPWDNCNCRACRDLGVEIVIFRSSNRNKRRGMHNLKIFYDHVCRLRRQNGN